MLYWVLLQRDPPAPGNDAGRRKDRQRIDIEPPSGFSASPSSGAGGHAARVGSVQDDLDRQDAAGWANLIAGSQTGLAVTFTARKFIVPISRSGQYEPTHCAKRRAKRCRTHANVKSSIRMLIPASEVRQNKSIACRVS